MKLHKQKTISMIYYLTLYLQFMLHDIVLVLRLMSDEPNGISAVKF